MQDKRIVFRHAGTASFKWRTSPESAISLYRTARVSRIALGRGLAETARDAERNPRLTYSPCSFLLRPDRSEVNGTRAYNTSQSCSRLPSPIKHQTPSSSTPRRTPRSLYPELEVDSALHHVDLDSSSALILILIN